jgi:hypothetical protein
MTDYFQQRSLDSVDAIAYSSIVRQTNRNTPHTVYLAFSGKKQVGKDTAVGMAKNILVSAGRSVKVTAFAEVLKSIAIDVLGLDKNLVYGSNKDKETVTHIVWDDFPLRIRFKYRKSWWRPFRVGRMTIREVLQVMGTDVFREMFEYDVWARSPFRNNPSGSYDVVLITDCRFPNERRMTEEYDGFVVRLTRDTGLSDDHPSELALDNATFEFNYENNGSLDELQDFVRETLKKLELI